MRCFFFFALGVHGYLIPLDLFLFPCCLRRTCVTTAVSAHSNKNRKIAKLCQKKKNCRSPLPLSLSCPVYIPPPSPFPSPSKYLISARLLVLGVHIPPLPSHPLGPHPIVDSREIEFFSCNCCTSQNVQLLLLLLLLIPEYPQHPTPR